MTITNVQKMLIGVVLLASECHAAEHARLPIIPLSWMSRVPPETPRTNEAELSSASSSIDPYNGTLPPEKIPDDPYAGMPPLEDVVEEKKTFKKQVSELFHVPEENLPLQDWIYEHLLKLPPDKISVIREVLAESSPEKKQEILHVLQGGEYNFLAEALNDSVEIFVGTNLNNKKGKRLFYQTLSVATMRKGYHIILSINNCSAMDRITNIDWSAVHIEKLILGCHHPATLIALSRFKQTKEICFLEDSVDPRSLSAESSFKDSLSEMPTLNTIEYRHIAIGPRLESMLPLHSLQRLILENCNLSRSEVKILKPITSSSSLEVLSLAGNPIGDELSALDFTSSLTFLSLACTELTNKGLKEIFTSPEKFSKLQELVIAHNRGINGDLLCLSEADWPELNTFIIDFIWPKDSSSELYGKNISACLKRMKKLTSFSTCGLPNPAINIFYVMSSLPQTIKNLDLCATFLNLGGIRLALVPYLPKLTNLNDLDLSSTAIDDTGIPLILRSIKDLNLQRLSIADTFTKNLTEEGINILVAFPKLTDLNVRGLKMNSLKKLILKFVTEKTSLSGFSLTIGEILPMQEKCLGDAFNRFEAKGGQIVDY